MIIDTHVHIGTTMNFDLRPEHVLYSMERYGIDFSLVSDIEAAELDHKGRPIPVQVTQNDSFKKVLEFAQKYPERIGVMPWMKLRFYLLLRKCRPA